MRTEETDGFYSLQVGTGRKSSRRLNAKVLVRQLLLNSSLALTCPQSLPPFFVQHHFEKYGVQPKLYVREFNVSKEGLLPPGFEIRAAHFVPGQFVDIQGVS